MLLRNKLTILSQKPKNSFPLTRCGSRHCRLPERDLTYLAQQTICKRIFYQVLNQDITCAYLLELLPSGDSIKYPQNIFYG